MCGAGPWGTGHDLSHTILARTARLHLAGFMALPAQGLDVPSAVSSPAPALPWWAPSGAEGNSVSVASLSSLAWPWGFP